MASGDCFFFSASGATTIGGASPTDSAPAAGYVNQGRDALGIGMGGNDGLSVSVLYVANGTAYGAPGVAVLVFTQASIFDTLATWWAANPSVPGTEPVTTYLKRIGASTGTDGRVAIVSVTSGMMVVRELTTAECKQWGFGDTGTLATDATGYQSAAAPYATFAAIAGASGVIDSNNDIRAIGYAAVSASVLWCETAVNWNILKVPATTPSGDTAIRLFGCGEDGRQLNYKAGQMLKVRPSTGWTGTAAMGMVNIGSTNNTKLNAVQVFGIYASGTDSGSTARTQWIFGWGSAAATQLNIYVAYCGGTANKDAADSGGIAQSGFWKENPSATRGRITFYRCNVSACSGTAFICKGPNTLHYSIRKCVIADTVAGASAASGRGILVSTGDFSMLVDQTIFDSNAGDDIVFNSTGVGELKINNCTFYGAGLTKWGIYLDQGAGYGQNGDVSDCVFQGYSGVAKGAIFCGVTGQSYLLSGTNNVFYDCTSNSNIVRRAPDQRTQNPLFTNAAAGNFIPLPSSPLLSSNGFIGALDGSGGGTSGKLGRWSRWSRMG